jgi:hypothetical protein
MTQQQGIIQSPLSEDTFTLDLAGCRSIYKVEILCKQTGKKVLLLLCGEDHRMIGNADDMIKEIIQRTECPVDILFERAHYNKREYILEEIAHSRKLSFEAMDPNNTNKIEWCFRDCLYKQNIPKQIDLQDGSQRSKTYYQKCLKPHLGKIKLWSLDIRRVPAYRQLFPDIDFFWNDLKIIEKFKATYRLSTDNIYLIYGHLLTLLYNPTTTYDKQFELQKVERAILKLLCFQKYVIHFFPFYDRRITPRYDDQFKIAFLNFFEKYRLEFTTDKYRPLIELNKMIKECKYNGLVESVYDAFLKDTKTPLYLCEQLDYLLEDSNWSLVEHFYNSLNDIYLLSSVAPLIELYTILRLIRSVRENKSKYIFLFMGNIHIRNIYGLLLKCTSLFQYKDESDNYYTRLSSDTLAENHDGSRVPITIPTLMDTSHRMQVYRRKIQQQRRQRQQRKQTTQIVV